MQKVFSKKKVHTFPKMIKGGNVYVSSRLMLLALLFLLPACSWFGSTEPALEGTDEEVVYDQLQRRMDWEQIVSQNQQTPAQSLACRKVVRLAQFRLGLAGREAIYECLSDSRDVLTSPLAALMMCDVYMQLGMVNMAQRAAFESTVKQPYAESNMRALRRLTETALITGHYELALKYISLLEEHSAHRKWARSMRIFAEHPERMAEEPGFQQLIKAYEETDEQFFL